MGALTMLAVVVFVLALTHRVGMAQSARPEYKIKADDPPIGSHIRRDAVSGGPAIPINKRYHELSAEERAIVHGWYESIAPGDEPPFPLDGLKPIHNAVRQGQARYLINGKVFVIATVGSRGDVAEVKVIGSPDADMTKFIASVLMLTKFKPAVCGGQACKMDFPLAWAFQVTR
jgi:hypothetical protein